MTQTIYDEFLKLNISKNKISIIPNGINIKDFKKIIDIIETNTI